jgi:acyl-CoA reductase-like NAD-dependent aldehyde dehydrogenase
MTTTEHRRFIGGEWTGASGEGISEDLDPYSGEVVATVAAGTREDAREAAEAAFPAWSPSPPAERQRVFLAAADILERRAEEVVGLLARLETFGPVATVEVVDGPEEAVAQANDTGYGLTAGILTGDPDRGLAERLQAGIVHVNDQPVHDEPQMPFGGVKDSGWGRFGGQAAIDEFTELRWVTVQSGTRPFPF